MPDSESNLVSSHENVINDTPVLSETKTADEKESVEKRTVTRIKKNGYPDSVYMNAAKIFQGIRTENSKGKVLVRYGNTSESPVMAFKDEHSRRVSYELAFSALKYQGLLEEVLVDSKAYPCYLIPDELTSLLVVMLYDLQDREFRKRDVFDEEELVAEVQEIGNYLYSRKVKLAAALARCRVKYDAPSIEYFMPEALRKHEQRASVLPVCAWINTFKISLEDVTRRLEMKGLKKVESVSDFDHYTYAVDQHCHDVLVFPSSLREELLNLDLFADGKLVLQDKSRSLAVHSAQALLSEGGDILVAHIGSPLTIAHMSVLTDSSKSIIFVCGVKSSAKEEELRNSFNHMGCNNIQFFPEDFTELEPKDPRLEKAKVVLLLPECSGLGAGDPMELILSEHRDVGLLRDLYQGFVSKDKLSILAERQLNELIHALKFNKVQAIVYCTCSVYPEENELVVQKALESGVEGEKVKRYRLIPSVFSTCSNPEDSTEMFFKMELSEISSGCFLAVLEREKDTSKKVPAIDLLASDLAKELLEGIVEEKPKEEVKKQKVKQRKRKVTPSNKPKAAKLHRQAGANVKAEVSASKAASKVPEKQVRRKKPASKKQEKTAHKTKGTSNIQEKTAHKTKGTSSIQEKTAHKTKGTSSIQEKTAHKTKGTSNVQEKTAHKTKGASDTQEKTAHKTKGASNIQEKTAHKTKGASNIQEKTAHKTKGASNIQEKTAHKTKRGSNISQKTVHQKKAASAMPQKTARKKSSQ